MNAKIQWIDGPPSGQLGVITWWDGTGTPDESVKTLQTQINTQLTKLSWQPIGVDGKLGPATCGALAWMGDPAISDKIDWSKINASLSAEAAAACSGHSYKYPTPVGQTEPVNPTPSEYESELQWMDEDDKAKALQATINTLLSELGYNPIPITGKLDAATCGALQVLDEETGAGGWVSGWGGDCQSYTRPTKKATAPAPLPPAPTPTCPEGEKLDPATNKCVPVAAKAPIPAPTQTKKAGFNWGLALLAGAAVVAIGLGVKGAAGSDGEGAAS